LILVGFNFNNQVFGQKQADNWYFGNKSAVNFASGSAVALTNSNMIAWGGCASISDSAGNLICYTNGSTVYDKQHNVMSNGDNLMGDYQYGNYGPSVVIVPRPGTTTTYYIFSINRNNTATGYPDALRYSTVVTTLNNGNGGVINRNYILSQKTFDAKITSVKHANGIDYWVIVHEFNTNKFYAFLVTNAGVGTTPVISSTGRTVVFPYNYYWWSGYLKASPDGKKVASTYNHYYTYTTDSANCELFNFNNSTGTLSNPVELTISRWGYYYFWGANSIEFSPDGSKLYLGDHANYWPSSNFEVYQYDLTASNIQNSRTKIGGVSGNWWWYYTGGMQLANNGKTYVTRYYSNFLGVINAPNQKGISCCYQDSGVYLTPGRFSYNGLPIFVTSWFFKHPFDFKNVCHGDTATFVIQNTSCLDSVLWDFGDTSSGGNNFSKNLIGKHLYSMPGKFTVNLTIYNMGIETTAKREIEVFPMPEKNLWVNDTFQCFNGNYFKFIDSTSISGDSIVSRLWKLDDKLNLSGNIKDTSVIFSSNDTFLLNLKFITSKGCYDSVLQKLYVNPEPNADFKVNDSVQCFNEHNFDFTNQSSIQYGSMNYQWIFGDTNTSVQANPNHTYLQHDTFIVRLTTVSLAGCSDSINKKVYLHPSPKAKFSIDDSAQCIRGNKFTFNDSSTIFNDVLSYNWYFGDNSTFYRKDTTHIYLSDDTFSVKLMVASSLGCKDSISKQIIVFPQPKAQFNINDSGQCLRNNSFGFSNTTTINSGSMSYLWQFGDNVTSSAQNPVHSYASHDTFLVKLVAISTLGCIDSISKRLVVYPMPSASFSINDSTQCFNEHLFNFSNLSTIASGHLQYHWNLGNGSTSSIENISNYRYLSNGSYVITFVVNSDNNCFDTVVKQVDVFPSPLAKFSINDTSQCLKWNINIFNNQSSIANGSISNYWVFGDGNNSNKHSPSHSYIYADTFSVLLISTSDKACSDTVMATTIVHPSPEISIGINDTSQCFEGNNFIFYNNSKIKTGNLSYRWFFGDGDSSQLNSPGHSYSIADTFDVLMIALSNLGCSDSIILNTIVHVHPMPQAIFSIDDSTQCKNINLFKFNNASGISSGTLSYLWSFGDNNSSGIENPSHQYFNADTFDVKLIAISNWDCRDSFIRKAVVFPVPEVDFSITDSAQCFSGNAFQFTNKSTISSGTIASWKWETGDGTLFLTENGQYSYASADTFDVELLAVSALNCSDSFSKKVIVFPMPVADFSIDTHALCLTSNVFNFSDKSIILNGSIDSFIWNTGDSGQYTTKNISHSYLKAGTFTVKHKVISAMQCSDSSYQQIFVYPMPQAFFSIDDSIQCFNEQNFNMTDLSNVSGDVINKLIWSINSDTVFNQKNITVNNLLPGISTLYLQTETAHLCRDTFSRFLLVHPSPEALFSVNDTHQCIDVNQFIFDNLSSISGGSMTYLWHFGDANQSLVENPVHSYIKDSFYIVRLLVESDMQCKDSVQLPVVVHPLPVADFSFSQACLLQEMNFTDLSTIKGPDVVSEWTWDFGEGSSTQQHPKFTFSQSGNKAIKLGISSNFGCKDDSIKTFYIQPQLSTPYLLKVSVEDNKDLTIQWEMPLEGVVSYYTLEKSTDEVNFYPIAKISHQLTDYLDKNLNVHEKAYTYRINAIDTCKFTSAYSNIGRNIVLHANDSDIFPIIYWKAYETWPEGVNEYRLEVFDEPSQQFELLGQFALPGLFTDSSTLKNQEFLCYRVVALHAVRPGIESISNSDCIPTTMYAFIPNAWTPNDDGINDFFVITGKNIVEYSMFIFDKWGREIFYSNDKDIGWDGKANGKLCMADTYYFYVKVKGSRGQYKIVKGGVSLIR